jgi:hypothetical protein
MLCCCEDGDSYSERVVLQGNRELVSVFTLTMTLVMPFIVTISFIVVTSQPYTYILPVH